MFQNEHRLIKSKETDVPGPAESWSFAHVGLAVVLAATFVVYWPALGGGVLWDDGEHITKPELRSLTGLARIWTQVGATVQYYPIVHTAFWIIGIAYEPNLHQLLQVLVPLTVAVVTAVRQGGEHGQPAMA